MTHRRLLPLILLAVFAHCAAVVAADTRHPPRMSDDPVGKVILVRDGVGSSPIILPQDPAPFVTEAAKDLAMYIEKISGARMEILTGAPTPLPKSAIYVGYQPILKDIFPAIDFDFAHPEEILLAADENNVVICGRDRFVEARGMKNVPRWTNTHGSVLDAAKGVIWTEQGTSCATYTFIEDCLDVRWFWPAPHGEDIVESRTISLPPFEYRYHPVIRKRHIWSRSRGNWDRYQRIWYYSYPMRAGHAFTDWWEKYHATHPEWFALNQGTRDKPPFSGGQPRPRDAKLCVSNPEVAAQWVANVEEQLKENPAATVFSGSPNDGPGFCTCARCVAMDHPDAEGRGKLTDRYVTFWNNLARGLKQRYPGREFDVGAYAYSVYRTPPLKAKLENNVVIGYVGNMPAASRPSAKTQKQEWLKWAESASKVFYRPNLFRAYGGAFGFPIVYLKNTAEDFRFLAENKCVGMDVDTMQSYWATQGPLYYLMAQLMYNPWQDADVVMKDYYQRAYGPAAGDIERYFQLMEAAYSEIVEAAENPDTQRGNRGVTWLEMWGAPNLLSAAERALGAARAKVGGAPEKFGKRVDFVRAGFEYMKAQLRLMQATAVVEKTQGTDRKQVERALKAWDELDEIAKNSPPYSARRPTPKSRKDLEAYLDSAHQPLIALKPAEWTLAWSDDFNRDTLGEGWNARNGSWSVERGALVSKGGELVSTRTFSGLHRLEFKASGTPDAMGVISDISPKIQCDEKLGNGYTMQFGGYRNTFSSIQRQGKIQKRTEEHRITPGKTHHIVAEVDGNWARLIVDGKTVAEIRDPRPLVGENNNRVGLYIYAGTVRISDLKVFIAQPVAVETENGGPLDPAAPR